MGVLPDRSDARGVGRGRGRPVALSAHPSLDTRFFARLRDFLERLVAKASDDNLFFMAGAITFNVLVAIVPLLLLAVGIAGFVLSGRFGDPASAVLPFILEALPQIGGDIDLVERVRSVIRGVVEERAGVSALGALVFVWISTRLVSTLRIVLREVFDLAKDRGVLRGKLFDAQIVLIAGALFLVNFGITLALGLLENVWVHLAGPEGWRLLLLQRFSAHLVAFASSWAMFLLIYRYLPARRIPWRIAVVAATFCAVLFEAAKLAFSWYATSVANYRSAYGNLATAAILFFWLYYSAVIFIVGGEVAQLYAMFRARRQRYERLVPVANPGGTAHRAGLVLLVLGASTAGPLRGQETGLLEAVLPGVGASASALYPPATAATARFTGPLVRHDGPYIVIRIAENRLYLAERDRVLWSAPVGTGTGFRLSGERRHWRFTTPLGLFKVQRKEKDPVWEAPDWYYVEKGLPIPRESSPGRRIPGVMGSTALYLGDGIAIHGTNNPELILHPDPERRRVSHGCIRLTNEAARTLYHLVDVGTPVLIY